MPQSVKYLLISLVIVVFLTPQNAWAGRTQISKGEIVSEVKKEPLLVRLRIKKKRHKRGQLGTIDINAKYSKILKRLHANTDKFKEYERRANMSNNQRSSEIFEAHQDRQKRMIKAIRKSGHRRLSKSREMLSGY